VGSEVVHIQDIVVHEKSIFSDRAIQTRISQSCCAEQKKAALSEESAAFWGRLNEEAEVIPAGAGSTGDLSRASH
jgi:hypothetical protein